MLILALAVVLLILGYRLYSPVIERAWGIEPDRPTPALVRADGVDYVPLPTYKVGLIQLLDIAGMGPIFGPILGALYGPVALLWIVLGCLLAGLAHDFAAGMLSLRHDGLSLPEVAGRLCGRIPRQLLRGFALLLLVLVGVVFVLGPAKLLECLIGVDWRVLAGAIFAYYFLATILPVDKLIGRLYPFFGLLLLFMTLGIGIALLTSGLTLAGPGWHWRPTTPEGSSPWPALFVILSCGAVSGFHNTQCPLMARCLTSERQARTVFAGAMLVEGLIALIWAGAAMTIYDSRAELKADVSAGTPSLVVSEVAHYLLGDVGGTLAILGVIVLPITSGDTAFRSARLILAEAWGWEQRSLRKRLSLAVPLFLVGGGLCLVDFTVIWRYFGWANQMLAMLGLWLAAVYQAGRGRPDWPFTLPAVFMTAVCATYALGSPLGGELPPEVTWPGGAAVALAAGGGFIVWRRRLVPAA